MVETNLGSEVVTANECPCKSIPIIASIIHSLVDNLDLSWQGLVSSKPFCEKNDIGLFACNHLCMHLVVQLLLF